MIKSLALETGPPNVVNLTSRLPVEWRTLRSEAKAMQHFLTAALTCMIKKKDCTPY